MFIYIFQLCFTLKGELFSHPMTFIGHLFRAGPWDMKMKRTLSLALRSSTVRLERQARKATATGQQT